jgi:hypothetical protein
MSDAVIRRVRSDIRLMNLCVDVHIGIKFVTCIIATTEYLICFLGDCTLLCELSGIWDIKLYVGESANAIVRHKRPNGLATE